MTNKKRSILFFGILVAFSMFFAFGRLNAVSHASKNEVKFVPKNGITVTGQSGFKPHPDRPSSPDIHCLQFTPGPDFGGHGG